MKKFMAMVLAATLAFGSTVMVYANAVVTEGSEPAAQGQVVAETVVPVVEEVPAEPEPVVEAPVNVPFTGVDKLYVTNNGSTVGKYLVFSNNEALSKKIFNIVNDTYLHMSNTQSFNYTSDQGLIFNYTLEETLTAAKVEVTLTQLNIITVKYETKVVATYYVNKANNSEITAAAYAELLAAETPAETPAVEAPAVEAPAVEGEVPAVEAVEHTMLPLRATAESLGYVVAWENGAVTVSKDDVKVSLVTGSAVYVNAAGEEVTLDAAPENIDSVLYVCADFFTEVLGVEVTAQ